MLTILFIKKARKYKLLKNNSAPYKYKASLTGVYKKYNILPTRRVLDTKTTTFEKRRIHPTLVIQKKGCTVTLFICY